jgi:uncharacterized protein YjiS (DUF1127 family)
MQVQGVQQVQTASATGGDTMSGTTATLFQRSSLLRALGRAFVWTGRKIALAVQVRAERRYLMTFNESALKDMGLNKGQAYNESARAFWDIPVDRLR